MEHLRSRRAGDTMALLAVAGGSGTTMMPSYSVHVQRLDPILADLRIEFAGLPGGAEIRGRLMGPRCPGISTVEIAYHLRRVEASVYQVLIPEPTLWTPERPYVYEGPIEWRQDGVKEGTMTVRIALKSPSAP